MSYFGMKYESRPITTFEPKPKHLVAKEKPHDRSGTKLSGDIYTRPPTLVEQIQTFPVEIVSKTKLTKRQHELYNLIAQGLDTKTIEKELGYYPYRLLKTLQKRLNKVQQLGGEPIPKKEQTTKERIQLICQYPFDVAERAVLSPKQQEVYGYALQDLSIEEIEGKIGYHPLATLHKIQKRLAYAQEVAYDPKIIKKMTSMFQQINDYSPDTVAKAQLPPQLQEFYNYVKEGITPEELIDNRGYDVVTSLTSLQRKLRATQKYSHRLPSNVRRQTYDRIFRICQHSPEVIAHAKLTPKQQEVYAYLKQNLTTNEIALELGYSPHTFLIQLDYILKNASRELPPKHKLTPREDQVLSLMAQGNTVEQISEQLGISKRNVVKRSNSTHTKLKATSQLNLTLRGLYFNILHPTTVLQDINVNQFDYINTRQQQLLNALVKYAGEKTTYTELARTLKFSKDIQVKEIAAMNKMIGTKNKIHLATAYAAFKGEEWKQNVILSSRKEKSHLPTPRQQEMLKLIAQGTPIESIAGKLSIDKETVSKHITKIKYIYEANSLLNTVLKAYKDKYINANTLLKTIDVDMLLDLTGKTYHFLNILTQNDGKASSYTDLAQALHTTPDTINKFLSRLHTKIGTKNTIHLAAVYTGYRDVLRSNQIINAADKEKLMQQVNIYELDTLSSFEKQILDILIANNENPASYIEIARRTGKNRQIIRDTFDHIKSKIGVGNHVQLIAAYRTYLQEYDFFS